MALVINAVMVMAAVYITVPRWAVVSVAVMSAGKTDASYGQCDYRHKNYPFHTNLLLFVSVFMMTGTAVATVIAVMSAILLSVMLMGSALRTVAYRTSGVGDKGFASVVVGTAVIVIMPRIAYAVMVMGGLNWAIRHGVKGYTPDIGKRNGITVFSRMGESVITSCHYCQKKYTGCRNY
jgi:hypothetical protein